MLAAEGITSSQVNLLNFPLCGLLLSLTIFGCAQGQGRSQAEHELGTESARAIDEALHRQSIPVGAIFCSPTHRAVQTIKLTQLGSFLIVPELGDSGQSMQRDKSDTRAEFLKCLATKLPPRVSNTLIVTQSPNIAESFSQDANNSAGGEALIIEPDGIGAGPVLASIKIDEWPRLESCAPASEPCSISAGALNV
jgi:hypothetical protein